MMAGKRKLVPTTVHADHLIQAKTDSFYDLKNALDINSKYLIFYRLFQINMVLDFGNRSWYYPQVILENYAFPEE